MSEAARPAEDQNPCSAVLCVNRGQVTRDVNKMLNMLCVSFGLFHAKLTDTDALHPSLMDLIHWSATNFLREITALRKRVELISDIADTEECSGAISRLARINLERGLSPLLSTLTMVDACLAAICRSLSVHTGSRAWIAIMVRGAIETATPVTDNLC